jgi:hypothetical protein
MDRTFGHRPEKTSVPEDIRRIFEEHDIEKVWDYLERTLHISRVWRANYLKLIKETPRNVSPQEFFIQYTLKNIDPHLSVLLQRKQSPMLSIIRYVLKDKIGEKRKEQSNLVYGQGWKR